MDEIPGKNKQKSSYAYKIIKVIPLSRIILAGLFITSAFNIYSYI